MYADVQYEHKKQGLAGVYFVLKLLYLHVSEETRCKLIL